MQALRAVRGRWLLALLWLACGCDALQAFRTGPGEVFNGEVIGSDSQSSQPSFIRQGFAAHTVMDLTFDPAKAAAYLDPGDAGSTLPPAGTLDTYVCPGGASACSASQRTPGLFRGAALEVIANLSNDALSQYDFPGGGRLRNYILVARFPSTLDDGSSDRNAMVFLSLMETGGIEARVIAPSVRASDGKTDLEPGLFGVFMLKRHKK